MTQAQFIILIGAIIVVPSVFTLVMIEAKEMKRRSKLLAGMFCNGDKLYFHGPDAKFYIGARSEKDVIPYKDVQSLIKNEIVEVDYVSGTGGVVYRLNKRLAIKITDK